MAPTGTQRVAERVQLANRMKNYQHAIVMDAEDSYEQKTLTFSGLAEVMEQVRMQVASDLRMPLTKLFGISAAGFNSGEDDIEVYNGMLEGTVRAKAKTYVLDILELRCKKLFGFIPEDLAIEFEPLRVLSREQVEKVKDSQFTRIKESYEAGLISMLEARDAMTKEDLLSIPLNNDNLPEGADEVGGLLAQETEGKPESGTSSSGTGYEKKQAADAAPQPVEKRKAEGPDKSKEAKSSETTEAADDYAEAKRRGTLVRKG
jgi:hypothetical protein